MIISSISGCSDSAAATGDAAAFAAAAACLGKKAHTLSLAFACLMDFSRMYLYVHYPTDVLASVVLGTLLAFIGTGIVNMINNFIQKRKTA